MTNGSLMKVENIAESAPCLDHDIGYNDIYDNGGNDDDGNNKDGDYEGNNDYVDDDNDAIVAIRLGKMIILLVNDVNDNLCKNEDGEFDGVNDYGDG